MSFPAWVPAFVLSTACCIAFLTPSSVVGDNGRGNPGLDFSLPRILHSPIAVEDSRVYFSSGSAELTPDARMVLVRQAAALRAFPDVRVEMIGYADLLEAATHGEKAALGRMRAEVVRDYLIAMGIAAQRITASGTDRQPLIPGRKDDAAMAAMRHVWTMDRP